mgnify:CR=1 FL=1
MALVGRTGEQAAIVQAFAPIDEGEGAVLALVGDAGIGKSALLQEVAAQAAERDLLLLGGRAAEHEADVPFGLVVAALDDHAGSMHARRLESVGVDLAAVLPAAADPEDQGGARPDEPGAAERFRYHRALRALLELIGRERPFVLVLDDVHWADEGSLEFILHLLRNPPRVPHLLVVATRPVEASARILDGVRTSPLPLARTLTVGPLDDAAAAQLVGDLPAAVRQRVVAEAGGNPLFLRELVPSFLGLASSGSDRIVRAVQF